MSRRYTDMLRALQYAKGAHNRAEESPLLTSRAEEETVISAQCCRYSIVHLFGDYPESDYGFPAKVRAFRDHSSVAPQHK
eukprot:2722691-Amphidinium_carterae.1